VGFPLDAVVDAAVPEPVLDLQPAVVVAVRGGAPVALVAPVPAGLFGLGGVGGQGREQFFRDHLRPYGGSRMPDWAGGRSGVESPWRLDVPYSFQIRAGLNTLRSMATASVSKRSASACRMRQTMPPSSAGRSMAYSRW